MPNNASDNDAVIPDTEERRLMEATLEAAREARRRAEEEREGRHIYELDDFVFDQHQNKFWDLRKCLMYEDRVVDKAIPQALWEVGGRQNRPIKPHDTIGQDGERTVSNSIWWPGEQRIIVGWSVAINGALIPDADSTLFNTYQDPPVPLGGRADKAQPWIDLVNKLYPEEVEREFFFNYCAHMLQRPHEKCHGAIVLAGEQGIGKDAILTALKLCVGLWNVSDIQPDDFFGQFGYYHESLMVVVNEVRPVNEEHRAVGMYNTLKELTAAPPETLTVNQKYAKPRNVLNRLRMFLTANNYLDLYVEPKDRRMVIMQSPVPQDWHRAEGRPDLFKDFFKWVADGWRHVAAWLLARDLSAFNPKEVAPKTDAWEAVVAVSESKEDVVSMCIDILTTQNGGELPPVILQQELIDAMGSSTVGSSIDGSSEMLRELRSALKSPSSFAQRMRRFGYMAVRNRENKEGRWVWRANGCEYRTKAAYVLTVGEYATCNRATMIQERGKAMLARLLASKGKHLEQTQPQQPSQQKH